MQIADLKKIVSYLQGVQTSYGEGTEEYSKDQLGDFQRDTFYEFWNMMRSNDLSNLTYLPGHPVHDA